MQHRTVPGVVAVALLAAVALGSARACPLEPAGTVTVRSVADGRWFTATDSRDIRLAGIVPPSEGSSGATMARATVETMLLGREVSLFRAVSGPARDRYGRLLAVASTGGKAIETSVQHALLERGLARTAGDISDEGCRTVLLRAEATARAAALGVWSDPAYVIQKTDDPAAVLSGLGRFSVVEGKVLSVRESGGTIYLNFGRRWSEDFTGTVAMRHKRSFSAAKLELKKLAGRYIRLRGTIEERGGPWIELVHPGQIEVLEQP